jgi:hypothetical protein
MSTTTIEALVSVVVATVAASGTIVAAWMSHRAERNTRPISNGFASDVCRRLGRIEHLLVNHLEDHAEHDLRSKKPPRQPPPSEYP